MSASKGRMLLVQGFAGWMAMTTLALGLFACSRASSDPKQTAAAHGSLTTRPAAA